MGDKVSKEKAKADKASSSGSAAARNNSAEDAKNASAEAARNVEDSRPGKGTEPRAVNKKLPSSSSTSISGTDEFSGNSHNAELSTSPASKWAQRQRLNESTDSGSGSPTSLAAKGKGKSKDTDKSSPANADRRGKSGKKSPAPSTSPPPKAVPEDAESIPLDLKPEDIELGEFLGDGVYSEVFKGVVYGTPVAVKKFKNQGFDPNVLKEVRKEVRIMRSIRHPNLLLFLGACTVPGQLMIVTELMDCSFHELLEQGVSLFDKIVMAKEAAKGLSWLHSLKPVIIHRDLKPENILVGNNMKSVKVADFGLSLVRDNSSAMIEEMKKIRGSPAFMSPEALLAKNLTPATDVYSFGMIMWELFTEGSPYDSLRIESFEQLIQEICEKQTREVIPQDLTPALQNIIQECWHPEPDERPTFIAVISALDDALLEHSIPDKNGRKMWNRCFRQDGHVVQDVPWSKFQQALEYHVDVSVNEKLWGAVQGMLEVKNDSQGKPGRVNMVKFGNLLKWFGPMEEPNANEPEKSFLVRMQSLFAFRWFHGDISTEQAETSLSEGRPGMFLVRFSSVPGQWALSKIVQVKGDPEPKTLHIRIQYAPNEVKPFLVTLGDETYEFVTLQEMVRQPILELGDPCPGSKYYAKFRVKQSHLGYVN